jgi:hypothetical protein
MRPGGQTPTLSSRQTPTFSSRQTPTFSSRHTAMAPDPIASIRSTPVFASAARERASFNAASWDSQKLATPEFSLCTAYLPSILRTIKRTNGKVDFEEEEISCEDGETQAGLIDAR